MTAWISFPKGVDQTTISALRKFSSCSHLDSEAVTFTTVQTGSGFLFPAAGLDFELFFSVSICHQMGRELSLNRTSGRYMYFGREHEVLKLISDNANVQILAEVTKACLIGDLQLASSLPKSSTSLGQAGVYCRLLESMMIDFLSMNRLISVGYYRKMRNT